MSKEYLYEGDLRDSIRKSDLPSENVSNQVDGKAFGIRALAYIIDTVVYASVTYAMTFVAGLFLGILLYISGREFAVNDDSTQCLNYVISLIMILIYFSIFEGLYGASPGKLITRMRVVKRDGRRCNLGTAIHRGLWRFIDSILFGAVAYSNMKPPLHQRLGDKKAHTLVVGNNEAIIQKPREWPWFLLAFGIYITVAALAALLQLIGML